MSRAKEDPCEGGMTTNAVAHHMVSDKGTSIYFHHLVMISRIALRSLLYALIGSVTTLDGFLAEVKSIRGRFCVIE